MKEKALPPLLRSVLDSLCYSVDQWMSDKHRLPIARRSVCNGYIVTRSYYSEKDVAYTDVVFSNLRVKLELYTYSPHNPETHKLMVLRFGHQRTDNPLVEHFDFSKYTKRKTIKKWIKDALLKAVEGIR